MHFKIVLSFSHYTFSFLIVSIFVVQKFGCTTSNSQKKHKMIKVLIKYLSVAIIIYSSASCSAGNNTYSKHIVKAVEFSEHGYYAESVSLCTKLIRRNINNADAYFYRAKAYIQLGYFEHAKADLKTLLDLQPEYPAAKDTYCLHFTGNIEYNSLAQSK